MRVPVSPQVRRLIAALVLGGGVWFIGSRVAPSVPREVDLRVSLAAFRDPPSRAQAVTITLTRDGEAIQEVRRQFPTPPQVVVEHVSIPPGHYMATVSLELEGRTTERTQPVDIHAGDTVYLAPPNQ